MSKRLQRILVGYDDSDAAKRALDRAAALVGYGAALTVVSVVPDGHSAECEVLSHARERLLQSLIPADYVQSVGEPAAQLVAAAEELDADVVVVGRRSHNLLRGLVLGSVSADVVRHAPCDVLVVS